MSISFNPTQALLMTKAVAINIAMAGASDDEMDAGAGLASSAMLVVRAIYRFENELGYYLTGKKNGTDISDSIRLRPVRKYHRLLTDALRDFEFHYENSIPRH